MIELNENEIYNLYIKNYNILCELINKNKLSSSDKDRIYDIVYDLNEIVLNLNYIVENDEYNDINETKFQKFLYKFKNKEFNNDLIKHKSKLKYYKNLINELNNVLLSYYKRDIFDLRYSFDLAYLLYYDINSQMIIDDYNLLNKGKYEESDIIYYDDIKNEINNLYGIIKFKNKLMKK